MGRLKHVTYNIHGELCSKHPVSCSSWLHIGTPQHHLRWYSLIVNSTRDLEPTPMILWLAADCSPQCLFSSTWSALLVPLGRWNNSGKLFRWNSPIILFLESSGSVFYTRCFHRVNLFKKISDVSSEVGILFLFITVFDKKFNVVVRLFSKRSQMTTKCGKNKNVVQSP